MKNKQIPLIITLTLLVGILSGVYTGSNASAGADNQAAEANVEGINKAYLPFTVSGFPLRSIFGAELDWISADTGLNEMSSTGMTWLRRNRLVWSTVEPVKNARLWDPSLDEELRAAVEEHLQIILTIRNAPGWAQAYPGSSCAPIKPSEYAAFAAFVHDAVARYSAPPFYIKYYEIWNELDAPINYSNEPWGCWGISADPYYGGEAYGELLNVVYPQAKAANPAAQVLLGGLLLDCDPDVGLCGDPNSPMFLAGVLRASSSFDGVSFHAYDYYQGSLGTYYNPNWASAWNTTGPVVTAKTQFIRDTLAEYGVTGKYLINTESAMLGGSSCNNDCETTKAYYVPQVYANAIDLGLVANVWYTALGWRNSGLLNPDLTPKPAYDAYVFARAELQNATLVAEIFLAPGVKGYEFDQRGQRILLLWSQDGSDHPVSLPWVPVKGWNVFGTEMPVSGTSYTVTRQPVYLERNP